MDIEDWYQLDYFDKRSCDTSRSMLDGIEHYLSFLSKQNIPSTFFILGELAKFLAKNSAFPPKTISVPRPAMLVAIVTAARRPAWEMIWASNS